MNEINWKAVAVIVSLLSLGLSGLAGFYELKGRIGVEEARGAETERKVAQELIGYKALLSEVGRRMDEMNQRLSRIEGRLERR